MYLSWIGRLSLWRGGDLLLDNIFLHMGLHMTHVIFTSSHIIILLQVVIETYTQLSPSQEDRHLSLILVVVFLHSMVVVVEMDNYED